MNDGCAVLETGRRILGQILLLRCKKTGQDLIYANTHLLFNSARGDIKLGQLAMLIANIQDVGFNKFLFLGIKRTNLKLNRKLSEEEFSGQILLLRCKKTGQDLIYANTHLLFNSARGDIKLGQLAMLIANVQDVGVNKFLFIGIIYGCLFFKFY
ncbi:unnamed protein product [Strongylus vulgaris]|uniref:Uncharacterized protein n=1 Tax=Strongylus vulgaris TaxID=40348 RepID=A0A3P7J9S4_STRVU|nr:unnamed protein product [Strongylus vulgaris]